MSDKKPGRGSDQFPLRLPDGMRERIKVAAEANGRSMNAEIIERLTTTFMDDEFTVASPNFDKLLQVVADIAAEKATRRMIERMFEYDRLPPEEKEGYAREGRAKLEAEKPKPSDTEA